MKDHVRVGTAPRWGRSPFWTFATILALCAVPLWAGQSAQQPAPAAQKPAAQQPAPQQPVPQQAAPQEPQPVAEESQPPEPAYQPLPAKLTLDAGTLVRVRVSDFLSSNKSKAGQAFSAELDQPVVVDGWVVARRGQTAVGRVAVAKRAGRIKGTSQLGITLTELVLVDGQQIPVHTQLIESSGGTTRSRDASAVATTTTMGTVIGGVAHGGEGAGVGAAIGAGAGLAGVLLTRGRPTIIPPETALTFQLQLPVTISTAKSGPAFRPVQPGDYGTRRLQRRGERNAPPRYRPGPPPYDYSVYGPWNPWYPGWDYYYPAPFYVGFGYGWGYGWGGRFGHHGRGGFRH